MLIQPCRLETDPKNIQVNFFLKRPSALKVNSNIWVLEVPSINASRTEMVLMLSAGLCCALLHQTHTEPSRQMKTHPSAASASLRLSLDRLLSATSDNIYFYCELLVCSQTFI